MLKIKELFARLVAYFKALTKEAPPVYETKIVDVGHADVYVLLVDGTSIQGKLQGTLKEPLTSKLSYFYMLLEKDKFAGLFTSEGDKVFQTKDVKGITIYRYSNLNEVTYEI